MTIHENITKTVGSTPLVRINRLTIGCSAEVLVKLESFNPLSSVKDRLGLALIEDAEANGQIGSDTVIIEPTSGNTGIGLAFVCAQRGYKLILTMPETMSIERRKLLEFLGAELVLTDGAKGMKGAIQRADELVNSIENSFMPHQFTNKANPAIHRKTTANEIWNDTGGNIDAFVGGVGTGGTITGVGSFLKNKDKKIKVVAVEPQESAVLSGAAPGPHKIQGIGAGFIPGVFDRQMVDEVLTVSTDDAIKMAQRLAKEEGILVGISSGAAMWAALELAQRSEFTGKTIVTLLPDTGERYLSTDLFHRN